MEGGVLIYILNNTVEVINMFISDGDDSFQ